MANDREAELSKMRKMINELGKDRLVFAEEARDEVAKHGIDLAKEGAVMPLDDVLKQDDVVCVAGKLRNMQLLVPGAKGGYFCYICNEELLLSPSSQAMEAKGARFMCIDCAHVNWQEENRGRN